MKLIMSDVSAPISPSEMDRKLLLDTLANMDVVKAGGKVVQGLVNRRSREKDNAEDINPAFPAEVSEDADLSQIQKRAALNLLFREESSSGQNLGLETEGNTVGRYHIQQDKAALVNPEIKDMTTSEYHRYIINNPEVEEEIVSKYIDIEIDKMLKNSGVDKSRLRHNEYASIVSNLYNKGNQPKLLKSASKLTGFRKDNPRDKRFTEKPYFEELKGKSQNVNQATPITNTGSITTESNSFPEERVIDVPEEKSLFEKVKPFIPVVRHLNEGGAIPMKEQMSIFNDGGLMDEGGTVDPVSGNDVPPGSTQEEVRDDIPAQLSEGEFVFPADVVRYIGLGNLMSMRQEAKMGLQLMDKMGQMGNSEDATIPDDLPFDINDLDIEDEPREMQVGGFVQPTQQQQQYGISGFQQAAQPTTGFAPTPIQAASQQFVQPMQSQQAAVPTMQAYKPAEIPTFAQTIGENPGQYDEMREYKNEAGEVRMIPFKAGQPIYPIPEGFTYVDPEATKTEEVTTTPTTPQTTSVRADASRDERQEERAKEEERIYGSGGGRLSIGEDTFGVSFDMPDGFVPGVMSGLGTAFGLATGKPLPEEVNVNFQFEDTKFTATGTEYNELKNIVKEQGSKSNAAKTKLAEIKENSDLRQIQKDERDRIKQEVEDEKLKEKAKEDAIKAAKVAKQRREEREQYEKEKAAAEAEKVAKSEEGPGSGMAPQTDSKSEEKSGGTQSGATGGGTAPGGVGGSYGGKGGSNVGGSGGYRAKGGLMEAPKPKIKKKMKRGGLASKK